MWSVLCPHVCMYYHIVLKREKKKYQLIHSPQLQTSSYNTSSFLHIIVATSPHHHLLELTLFHSKARHKRVGGPFNNSFHFTPHVGWFCSQQTDDEDEDDDCWCLF